MFTLLFVSGGGSLFPCWLQRLLYCACAVNHVDIEMCAVSTVLDLIVLTQSALVSQHQCHVDQLSTTGATRVLIKPLLTATDLSHLNSSTSFYQVVYLKESSINPHVSLCKFCKFSIRKWVFPYVLRASATSQTVLHYACS